MIAKYTTLISAALLSLGTVVSADQWPANIDVKENAFCEVLKTYEGEIRTAKQTKNQIKIMQVQQKRLNDIKALMPTMFFENWTLKVELVDVGENLDAMLIATMPCEHTVVGEGVSSTDTMMYGQLSNVSSGDFILASGTLLLDKDGNDETPDTFGAAFTSIVKLN